MKQGYVCLFCGCSDTIKIGTHDCPCHSKAPENYERDHSHYHCWEVENPPCGLKGLHRCCLCEKPVPEAPETVEIAEYASGRKTANGIEIQAPTDESWEKEFDTEFYKSLLYHKDQVDLNTLGIPMVGKDVKSFIASLIQKEREKGFDEGKEARKRYDIERNYGTDATIASEAFEEGKSEAFSLVRKMIEGNGIDFDASNNVVARIVNEGTDGEAYFEGWNASVESLLKDLSTLEGK